MSLKESNHKSDIQYLLNVYLASGHVLRTSVVLIQFVFSGALRDSEQKCSNFIDEEIQF